MHVAATDDGTNTNHINDNLKHTASNPPTDAEQEHITFFNKLDALHNELTLLLLPSTVQPRIIKDQTTPTTVAVTDDGANTDKLKHTAMILLRTPNKNTSLSLTNCMLYTMN